MANIDKVSVKNTVYNIVSPAVVSDYIEVIGGACTKPDGYVEDEVILAKQNDVQLLFKATQDIAFGANIVENTNCVRTTLEEVLKNAGGGGGASSADQVSYDNSDSGLEAENVQEAVDELATNAGTASSQIQTLTNQANAMVNVYGAKNLLANKMASDSAVSHGITFARQSDGSVHATGSTDGTTASIYYYNNFNNSFPFDVIASGGVENGIQIDVFWKDSGGITHAYVVGASEVTIPANTFITNVVLTVTDPHSNVDVTFKPMFRDARIVNPTYEPYAMTNQELTRKDDISTSIHTVTFDGTDYDFTIAKSAKTVQVFRDETIWTLAEGNNLIGGGFPKAVAKCVVLFQNANGLYRVILNNTSLYIYSPITGNVQLPVSLTYLTE